jgi:hypothetical protein
MVKIPIEKDPSSKESKSKEKCNPDLFSVIDSEFTYVKDCHPSQIGIKNEQIDTIDEIEICASAVEIVNPSTISVERKGFIGVADSDGISLTKQPIEPHSILYASENLSDDEPIKRTEYKCNLCNFKTVNKLKFKHHLYHSHEISLKFTEFELIEQNLKNFKKIQL